MEKVYVRLKPADVEAVKAVSREERRHPSDQLGLVVQAWLREREGPKDTPRLPAGAGATT